MERDQQNFEALQTQLEGRQLPPAVFVEPRTGDCFKYLQSLVKSLARNPGQIGPAFVFVDPYGFKISGGILRDLMQAGRVELFVNVMWREMHMGLEHAKRGSPGWAQTFDFVFAGNEWRDLWTIDDSDAMGDQVVAILAEKYGSRWSTTVRMLDGGRTRYLLTHLSNHDDGRDLMKECVWKVCPTGNFSVNKSTIPGQQFLIEPEPDLTGLRAWTVSQLREGSRRWSDLEQALRQELWLNKHLREVLNELRRDNTIAGENGRRFTRSADPLLRLIPQIPRTPDLFN